MVLYPTALPLDSINLLVNDIKGNSVTTDKAAFAKALWELTGFALKSKVGEPSGAPLTIHAHVPVTKLSSAEVASHLQSVISGTALQADLEAILAQIPWASIIQWALTTLLTQVAA